jgi:hypothetical protein
MVVKWLEQETLTVLNGLLAHRGPISRGYSGSIKDGDCTSFYNYILYIIHYTLNRQLVLHIECIQKPVSYRRQMLKHLEL